jgi:hypothetical protein
MKFMKKWDGLKSYNKEKLITALFVMGAVTGRKIVTVRTAVAALRHSPVIVLPSPITFHTASQNAVNLRSFMIEWKEQIERKGMFNLWGFPDALAKAHAGNQSPKEVAEARAKREAEKKIDEIGRGECFSCKEEIVKNERGFWESASLLEYCSDTKDHKHRPKIVWKIDESI